MQVNLASHRDGISKFVTLHDPDDVNPEQWDALSAADEVGTFFQGRLWTTAWYRTHQDEFDSLLVAVEREGSLVGLAPLAVERATHHLVFAGGRFSDYRDVLALEGARAETLRALIETYKQGGFRNVLKIGTTMPESPTAALAPEIARAAGLGAITRSYPSWRWWPELSKPGDNPMRKKTVRYTLNYLKRIGDVRAQWIRSRQEWDSLKCRFYQQHSLRQIYGSRTVSFDNPSKRAMYDLFFDLGLAHVTALWAGDSLVAMHFGCAWDGILFLGPPSFDIRYARYSPALALLAFTIEHAAEWGLRGFDLTIGEGDMKSRLGNQRVLLPMVELYPSALSANAVALRDGCAQRLKNWVGQDRWKRRIRPAALDAAATLGRARQRGAWRTLRLASDSVAGRCAERVAALALMVRPDGVHRVQPALAPGDFSLFHEDEPHDLLKSAADDPDLAALIAEQVQTVAGATAPGRVFHTMLVGDRLAAWGWSRYPLEPGSVDACGARFDVPPDSLFLHDFYVLPEFRGRDLFPALLSHVLDARLGKNVKQAWIVASERDAAALRDIRRVGFQPVLGKRHLRLLRWRFAESTRILDAG